MMPALSTNTLCLGALLLLASCASTRITPTLGRAELGSDFDPADNQTTVGLEVSDVPVEGGIGFEVGVRYGKGTGLDEPSGVTVTAENFEVYTGPRYEWSLDRWRPFLSGGLSTVRVVADRSDAPSESFTDIGFYASGGVDYQIGEAVYFGLAIRRTFEQEGTLYGYGEVDSWLYLARLGFAF